MHLDKKIDRSSQESLDLMGNETQIEISTLYFETVSM